MLTVSLLLVCDMFGLFPDVRESELEYRKSIAESVALQTALELERDQGENLHRLLTSIVSANANMRAAAVISSSGAVLGEAGAGTPEWLFNDNARSSPEHLVVELLSATGSSGSLQLIFAPLDGAQNWLRGGTAVAWIILYIAMAGFVAYFLFLRKVMKELDPGQVLPDRVRKALDTLSEGLIILDDQHTILFANSAFLYQVGSTDSELVGKSAEFFEWRHPDQAESAEPDSLPWNIALGSGKQQNDVILDLALGSKQARYSVNVSLIHGEEGRARGTLVTLSNITEVEQQRHTLERALLSLRETQAAITRKNEELFVLATRDFLTNALNRRAFFENFENQFAHAKQNNLPVGLIMLDLDKFKSINDTYGHSVGDEVICYAATVLQNHAKGNDLVARFGGEEFCMVLADSIAADTLLVAERIRKTIKQGVGANFEVELSLSASLGVAHLPSEATTTHMLIDHADKALYHAKENGRNQVAQWHQAQISTVVFKGDESDIEAPSAANTNAPGEHRSTDLIADGDSTHPPIPEVGQVDAYAGDFLQTENEDTHALTNRSTLVYNIDRVIRRADAAKSASAVLVIDIDTLQQVSNTVGYTVAMNIGAKLVERLKQTLRTHDMISHSGSDQSVQGCSGAVTRTGQDAIVLLISDISNPSDIPTIVHRLLVACQRVIKFEGSEYYLNVHIGVAVHGIDGDSAEELLRNASIACNEVRKKPIGDRYRFFSKAMNEAARREFQLQSDLPVAIEKNQLSILFQPKVSLSDGSIIGFEALMRWKHPELGELSPSEFIAIAERTDTIIQLNHWVIDVVTEQLCAWHKNGIPVASTAINISAVELRDTTLADRLINTTQQHNLEPKYLEIEITESASIDSLSEAKATLDKLKQNGFSIAVDDFGTGYASLTYLQHFSVDRLKIEKSFIDGITTNDQKRQLVQAIIALGRSMGIRVLAEGVETDEQLKLLREFGCDEVQGYFFSKPVDATTAGYLFRDQTQLRQRVLALGVRDEDYDALNSKFDTTDGSSDEREKRVSLAAEKLQNIINQYPAIAQNDAFHRLKSNG